MFTEALRLYGKNDIKLEKFQLPAIEKDEILAKVVCDSLCMSSYKAAIQGPDHKRVPNDIAKNPIILGHEFCGEIVEVGEKWKGLYRAGDKFIIQPALNYKGTIDAPGYSFPYIGGCATYIIIPHQVMECGCLLPYDIESFFYGSLSEPMSCVIGSYKEFFHTTPGKHEHKMGVLEGGSLLVLAGAGPMGLGAIDYIIHCDRRPSRVIVTDINDARLEYAKKIISPETAKKNDVELIYVNTSTIENPALLLLELNKNKGYDDILVMAPVKQVVELADEILAIDGCLSFFAGPTNNDFKAEINFYNIHYSSTHFIGTVGGNSEDMLESISMIKKGLINPAALVTHIGGLNCSVEATLKLPQIPGGKKLIYTHINLELTAIEDFEKLGNDIPIFKHLSEIVKKNDGLWCEEAEKYLLESDSVNN